MSMMLVSPVGRFVAPPGGRGGRGGRGGLQDALSARSWRVLLGAALAGLALSPAPAAAQQIEADVPPVVQASDENGVDLVTRKLTLVYGSISIGPGGPGSLTYNLANSNSAQTELSGFIEDNYPTAGKYNVTVGGGSETFTLSGTLGSGTFTQDQGRPSTLTYNSATGEFTYTRPDGTVALFTRNVVPGGTQASAPYIVSLTYPGGERLTYHYKLMPPVPNQSTGYYWVRSVATNLGYQLRYTFAPSEAYPGYYRVAKVVLFNMANESCDPDADSCTLSANWPSYTFDGTGGSTDNMQQVTRHQKATTSSGSTSTITFPTGRQRVYQLDGSERVVSVSDGGANWTYSYPSPYGGTTLVYAPEGGSPRVVNWTTDKGYITGQTVGGVTTNYTHDSAGRVVTEKVAGQETIYTYDARGNLIQTRRISATPGTPADVYTSASYPTSCTNPKTCNKPSYTIDSRSGRTDYSYDAAHGGVTSITLPAGANGVRPQTRYTYAAMAATFRNGSGAFVSGTPVYRLTSTSECATQTTCAGTADEVKTSIAYSAAEALMPSSTTSGSGDGSLAVTTSVTYYPTGDVKTTDGPMAGSGDVVRNYYNDARLLTGTIGPDPDGAGPLRRRAVRVSHDADGRTTSSETGTALGQGDGDMAGFQPLLQRRTEYDSRGRKSKEWMVSGTTTVSMRQISYTAGGLEECVADRLNPSTWGALPGACTQTAAGSHGPDRITRNVYDAYRRVSSVVSGVGTSSERTELSRTYTNFGKVETITDANGNKTTYEFDGFQREKRILYPSPATAGSSSTTDYEAFTYDAASNIVEMRQRNGSVIALAYDALSRRTSKQILNGGAVVSATAYTYDNKGRQVTMSRGGETLSLGYDALDRVRTETSALGTITNTFDAAGRRTRMTWPGGAHSVDYEYDVAGQLTAVREPGHTSGAGVLATFSYDDSGRRTRLQRGNGTSTTYGFDGGGRLETLAHDLAGTSHDQNSSFIYSPAGQIASRTTNNAAYDWADTYSVTRPYTANGLNQQTSAGAATITYDANGNLASSGSDTFQYDLQNRLTSASTSSGSATLAYDPADRLKQTSGAAVTRFLYDGQKLIGEYDAAGNLLRRYAHTGGDDEPIVWYEGSGTGDRRWMVADERRSVVAVTNSSGAATTVNTYDPYGIPGASNGGRFQYTGQTWLSDIGLFNYKARIYSPTLGRFMQPDPIGYGDGLNMYLYVGNDPVNKVDSTGLCANGIQLYWTRVTFTNGVYNPDKSFSVPYGAPMCFDSYGFNMNEMLRAAAMNHRPGASELKVFTLLPPTKTCRGRAEFTAVGPGQALSDGALSGHGISPDVGTVAVNPQQFGIPFGGSVAQNAAGQRQLAELSRQVMIHSPDAARISQANGGPAGPYTIGDVGDRNVRSGDMLRLDLYRFPTRQAALNFGRRVLPVTISGYPADRPCPAGTR